MAFRQSLAVLSQKSRSKSASWVSRQSRDPYVKKRIADPASYRARSAFKLIEINDQLGQFLDQPDVNAVVDLGAAPGGWSQVVAGKFGWGTAPPEVLAGRGTERKPEAAENATEDALADDPDADSSLVLLEEPKTRKRKKKHRPQSSVQELEHFDPLNIDEMESSLDSTSSNTGRGTIVAVDLLPINFIPGVQTIRGDFMLESTTRLIRNLLVTGKNPFGKADVILSDMAANASGNTAHDIQSSLEICEAVFEFAKWNLRSADSIGRKRGGVLL